MSIQTRNYYKFRSPDGLFWCGEVSKSKFPAFSVEGNLFKSDKPLAKYNLFRSYFDVPELETITYTVGVISEITSIVTSTKDDLARERLKLLERTTNYRYYAYYDKLLTVLAFDNTVEDIAQFKYVANLKKRIIFDSEDRIAFKALDRPFIHDGSIAVRSMMDLMYVKLHLGERFGDYIDVQANPFLFHSKKNLVKPQDES